MKDRTPLSARKLPGYTKQQESANMITHAVGCALGVYIFLVCCFKAKTVSALIGSILYGISMITLYAVSAVYHGLRPGIGKLVMQIVDHCTIYFLIAGTYTPILLVGFIPVYPAVGWALFAAEWGLAILAATLTAIDLRKFRVFSMICYIGLGWGIIFFLREAMEVLGHTGFGWLLAGGISYTIGAVLYGVGSKKTWMHTVFHIFVILGSMLQFVAIYYFVL